MGFNSAFKGLNVLCFFLNVYTIFITEIVYVDTSCINAVIFVESIYLALLILELFERVRATTIIIIIIVTKLRN